MAVEAVQELVTRFQNVQAQISEKQAELEKLRKAHLAFWEKFQKECEETGHSLTQEEREALSNPKSYPIYASKGHLTLFGFKIVGLMQTGYRCPYCLKGVRGKGNEVYPQLDLRNKECFFGEWHGWIGIHQEEDKWPLEKVAVLKSAKKEVEDFFGKAEPLEQAIETLKKEEEEIKVLLETTWELLDKALGKDVQRRRIFNEYEERIREIERCIPRPYDPDAYYKD